MEETMDVEMMDGPSQAPEEGAASSVGPRQRLVELCLAPHWWFKAESVEREIRQLAQTNPEVFLDDILKEGYQGMRSKEDRRSALHFIIRLGDPLSVETFEAVYGASKPGILESFDSWGDTVLLEFLGTSRRNKKEEFELLKALISKSNSQLAIRSSRGKPPIMKAVERDLSEEMIRYMIEHHPGDPYREETKSRKTLLAAVASGRYSLDFVRGILEQYPEAVKIQETDYYASSAFHAACHSRREDILRLLLSANPQGAFMESEYRVLPLHEMRISHWLEWNEDHFQTKKTIAVIAKANPRAIFWAKHDKNHNESSPFSELTRLLFRVVEREETYRDNKIQTEAIWSSIYLLLSIFRWGEEAKVDPGWTCPTYPLHMVASAPCPSSFLVHVAKSNVGHLLRYDNEGRSVLALALQSGHSYGMNRPHENRRQVNTIMELVNLYPRIVGFPDRRTGLYPFMTAACAEESIVEMGFLDNSYTSEKEDAADYEKKNISEIREAAKLICLNTIYFLLRADPSKVL